MLLSTLDNTTDDKLCGFAIRLALSGHRGIPREGELDFFTEADAAFRQPKPKKRTAKEPTSTKPTLVKGAKAKTAAKKKVAA